MKIIDTSKVNSTRSYPGLANVNGQSIGNGGDSTKFEGLDFLQSAVKDMSVALASAVTSDLTKPCILTGCILTGASMSAGWIFVYNTVAFIYEIFYVPAQTVTGSGSYVSANINQNPTDNGTSAPLTTLSDGSQVSMHNQRTITLTYNVNPNQGNVIDFGEWVPTNLVLALDNIATLNSQVITPYSSSDRVTSGSPSSSENVVHTIIVPNNINGLQVFVNANFDTGGASEVTCRVYVGGTISGHTAGIISGTISGGTLIKTVSINLDSTYNLNNILTAIILTNVTSGQAITVTLEASGTPPSIQNSSDLSLVGSIG